MVLHCTGAHLSMSKLAKPNRWSESTDGKHDDHGPNVVPIRVDGESDPLGSFAPEAGVQTAATPKVLRVQTTSILTFAALVAVAAIAAGVFFFRARTAPGQPAPSVAPTGHVVLNSRPAGAMVLIDGVSRGASPLELDLPAGSHDVVFRAGGSERRIALKVDANARVTENVDLPAASASTGLIEVTSEPAGARVSLDGTPAGATPLTLRNVAAARHTVAIASGGKTVNRSVEVAAGATTSVFVALAQPTASSGTGTFAVESPVELRILENGQLLGLSNGAPIAVSAGRHQFDLINEGIEFRTSRTLSIDSGKTARLSVTLPNGALSVNALPWAEVFVDGRSIGVTPLGSVAVPVGSHEVVWKHPQFGEKRRTIVVGAQTPARISMDMSK
jgi:PEGA domain-containing protein